MVSLGEITHLPKNYRRNTRCGCGVPLRECATWAGIVDVLERRMNIDFKNDPYSLFLGFIRAHGVVDLAQQTRTEMLRRSVVVGYTYFLRRFGLPVPAMPFRDMPAAIYNKALLFDTVATVLDAQAIVDSSKFYLDAIELYKRYEQQTVIIVLTRDGRGVLNSAIKRGSSPKNAIRGWKRTYQRSLALLERHVPKENLFYLKYEDLTRQPTLELQRLCHFIGVEFEQDMLDFGNQVTHITNGNRMRFSSDKSIKHDDAWRRSLTRDQLSLFEQLAGKLNRKLGYE